MAYRESRAVRGEARALPGNRAHGTKADAFRERLAMAGPVVLAGAHNGLSGRLVQQAGFDCIWASGFEISATFGLPDANILTMSENVAIAESIDRAVTIPVVADCDNGYGNAINVIRTVQTYERAGIAAICIEDNAFPKRCSFYDDVDRRLESAREFAGKVRAATEARANDAFAVIARTEALVAGYGIADALERGHRYAEAGADLVLIHSKRTDPDEVHAFAEGWRRLGINVPLACIPTTYGATTMEGLHEAGFKLIIYANFGLRASIKAMRQVLGDIVARRSAKDAEAEVVSLDDVKSLVGVDEMRAQEKAFMSVGAEPEEEPAAVDEPSRIVASSGRNTGTRR